MAQTCSRLRQTPCKWFACGSVLNSLEALVAHLHEIHAQEDELAVSVPHHYWSSINSFYVDVYVGHMRGDLH